MNTTETKNKGGRKVGSLGVRKIRKQAVQNLKDVVLNEEADVLARVIASVKILDEVPK